MFASNLRTAILAATGDCDAIYRAVLVDDGVVDITTTRADGKTPLHVAAQAGHSEACLLLTEASADPTVRDKLGLTALHYAAQEGHTEVMGILLIQHPDIVNDKALGGRTALHFAAATVDHDDVRLFTFRTAYNFA